MSALESDLPEIPISDESGTPSASSWDASLLLDFKTDAEGRTRLLRRDHSGPLRIQRTFHPEGPVCHAYLLHPPGGVVGGDRLDIRVKVDGGAHAVITTPAAGKFYRSAGARASQVLDVEVAPGGVCEWLPGMNILHGGARVVLAQRFRVAPSSRLLAWDTVGLGRPGSGDGFQTGDADLRSRFEVSGVPEWIDRWRLVGGSPAMAEPWGMQGHGYTGTLLAWPVVASDLERLRMQQPPTGGDLLFAGTFLPGLGLPVPSEPERPGLLVARWLARDGEALGWRMREAWSQLRPSVVGRPACPPRVWST